MPLEQLSALALFAFVSTFTPGPNNIMLMTSGANVGFARTIPHMLGIALGFAGYVAVGWLWVNGGFQRLSGDSPSIEIPEPCVLGVPRN